MKKLLIAMAAGLALTLGSGAAWADYVVKYNKKGSGHVLYTYYDDKGNRKSWHLYTEDGKWVESGGPSNPGPEGGSKGTGDPKSSIKDKEALLLQKGGTGTLVPEIDAFWETPLGNHLSKKGKGKGKYNQTSQPGPDDDGSGGSGGGSHVNLGKGYGDGGGFNGGGGSVGGFEPNSGGIKGYINKNKGKTGKKGEKGGSNGDNKTGVGQGAVWGDLPGPPELVNPNPVASNRAKAKQPGGATLNQLPSAAAGQGRMRTSTPTVGGAVGKLR